jgi:hypothetical protein
MIFILWRLCSCTSRGEKYTRTRHPELSTEHSRPLKQLVLIIHSKMFIIIYKKKFNMFVIIPDFSRTHIVCDPISNNSNFILLNKKKCEIHIIKNFKNKNFKINFIFIKNICFVDQLLGIWTLSFNH